MATVEILPVVGGSTAVTLKLILQVLGNLGPVACTVAGVVLQHFEVVVCYVSPALGSSAEAVNGGKGGLHNRTGHVGEGVNGEVTLSSGLKSQSMLSLGQAVLLIHNGGLNMITIEGSRGVSGQILDLHAVDVDGDSGLRTVDRTCHVTELSDPSDCGAGEGEFNSAEAVGGVVGGAVTEMAAVEVLPVLTVDAIVALQGGLQVIGNLDPFTLAVAGIVLQHVEIVVCHVDPTLGSGTETVNLGQSLCASGDDANAQHHNGDSQSKKLLGHNIVLLS